MSNRECLIASRSQLRRARWLELSLGAAKAVLVTVVQYPWLPVLAMAVDFLFPTVDLRGMVGFLIAGFMLNAISGIQVAAKEPGRGPCSWEFFSKTGSKLTAYMGFYFCATFLDWSGHLVSGDVAGSLWRIGILLFLTGRECLSLLENAAKLGYRKYIPGFVRDELRRRIEEWDPKEGINDPKNTPSA